MTHNTLENYYKTVYSLTCSQSLMSITELENMIPFEIDIYVSMLNDENERRREQEKQQQLIADAIARKGY